MQIPPASLKFLADILGAPPAGGSRRSAPAAQPEAADRRESAPLRPTAAKTPGAARIGTDGPLADAARALRTGGRLPPRGSLLDIRA